jgi:hypothetical protein
MNILSDVRDERQLKALIGLSENQFTTILIKFTDSYKELKIQCYEDSHQLDKRKPGAGSKGRLDTMDKKLFFILFYLKTYPTFDELGYQFGLDRSNANRQVHQLMPVLHRALEQLGVMPKRAFESVEDYKQVFDGIEKIIIDATERPHARPVDEDAQKAKYSGKRRQHTVKNTVISDTSKYIYFLGHTVDGSIHDYALFKGEFPPDIDWFESFSILVDLGYLGIQGDYKIGEIGIPNKKPRKSKSNPSPYLTDEQKEENKALSKVRVIVEHAIGGMKIFGILRIKFRNRITNFVDDVAIVAAGLWNMKLCF